MSHLGESIPLPLRAGKNFYTNFQKTPGLEALKMSAPPLVAETKNACVPENQVKIENCCTDVTSKNCTRGSFGLITGVYQIMCFLQYLYQ